MSLDKNLKKGAESTWNRIENVGDLPPSSSAAAPRGLEDDPNVIDSRYAKHRLLRCMMKNEKIRNEAFRLERKTQLSHPKSNQGWVKTLFIYEGRALDCIVLPFTVTVLHASVYTVLQEVVFEREHSDAESWESFMGYIVNTTLAFLLVFRLNRAAERYWVARAMWGRLVASTRTMSGGLLVHGGHNTENRDHALRWLAALPLTVMHFVRGEMKYIDALFSGLLCKDELRNLESNSHPPLCAGEQVRFYIKAMFRVTAETPASLATAWSHQLDRLESQLHEILDSCGGLERIAGTPLPIAYVSHLRTFLLLNLNMYPYVWGHQWGWGTIPIVALSSFALLGIEASSAECEAPFRKDRVNALDMDSFCQGTLAAIQQAIKNHADREIDGVFPGLEMMVQNC